MKAIYKKELLSYFITPAGYVFLAIFLAINGILFSMMTLLAGSGSSVEGYFTFLVFSFVVVMPILTMKVFSEERKTKTEQLLLTSPVSLFSIVLGKFLASFTVFAGGILASCFNFVVLYQYGTPNGAVIFSSVICLLLIGGACIAIGVFISSLTENQFVACIVTMAILLAFVGISLLESGVSSTFLRTIMSWVSILTRYTNFSFGIFDIPALIYYMSISFVFLFLTVRVLEKRRWN